MVDDDDQIQLPTPNDKTVPLTPNTLQNQDIIDIHQGNMNDYKSKNICELIYTEEPLNENEKFVSQEKLIEIMNIKEPYNKNNSKDFIHKNLNKNSEFLFSSNFESGNLRFVIKHNPNEYDLILRPETGSLRTFHWFYFRVKMNKINDLNLKNYIVKFNIINLTKKNIIFNDTVRVLCYYNNSWSRDTHNIFYYINDLPYLMELDNNSNNINNNLNSSNENDENNNESLINNNKYQFHTLTFSFDFSKITTQKKYVYFAYCYPYTYSQLDKYLSSLVLYKNILRFDVIGKSLDGINIHMLIITNFKDNFESLANKKSVIFTARVHPGESNSSYVIQGVIDFLLSNETIAENLRKNFIFKIIPMLNPDGVIRGNYRMNTMGKDLNRCWVEPTMEITPSIFCSHQMIQKTLNSRDIFLFCDFHGHSNKNNFFLYSCKSKSDFIKINLNTILPNNNKKKLTFIELVFQEIFSRENSFFDKSSCVNKIVPSKIKTARAVLKTKYKIDYSYCLETSLGSMKNLRTGEIIPYSIEQYKKIGKDFCISLYKLNNPKIYFVIYNSLRLMTKAEKNANEKKNKKSKLKDLVLPLINFGYNNQNNSHNHIHKNIINNNLKRISSSPYEMNKNINWDGIKVNSIINGSNKASYKNNKNICKIIGKCMVKE